MRVMMMQFNMTRAPFNDVHVRRAINYAFDYDGFNKDILGGLVERNPTPLPNTIWGVPKDVKGYSFDIDKAKAELAKASAQDRQADRARLPHRLASSRAGRPAAAERPHQDRHAVEGDRHSVADDRRASSRTPETTPDVSIYWISTYYADPHNWVGEMFHPRRPAPSRTPLTTRTRRWTRCSTRRCSLTDQAERSKLYEEATRIVVDEAAGLWIYNTKWYGPYSNKLQGHRLLPDRHRRRRCAPPTTRDVIQNRQIGAVVLLAMAGCGLGLAAARIQAREMRIVALISSALAWLVPTLPGSSPSSSSISRVIPSDPVALLAGETAPRAQIELLRQKLGLDRPLLVQLLDYYRQLASAATSAPACSRRAPCGTTSSRGCRRPSS